MASLTEDDIRALAPILRSVACRAVGDATVAKDLVQETLLAAIKGLDTFDGRSEVRTWIIGILSHKVLDHFRRARRWDVVELDEDTSRLLEPSRKTPEGDLSNQQALDVLERALRSLPEKERMAVVLCDVEGLSREEVCNALEVSPTHLRVLLHRARHRLRKSLEDAGV